MTWRLLSFVPKTSGFVGLIKVLYAFGGGTFEVPSQLVKLLWILAVCTMTVGNVLGLLQSNINAFRLQLRRPQRIHAHGNHLSRHREVRRTR